MKGKAKGHLYHSPGRKVWMLAYYGPRADGTWGLIRESAKTEDERKARKLLDAKLRCVANYRDGIAEFEGPETRRVTVTELLEDLAATYRVAGIKGFDRAWNRIKPGSPLRERFGLMRAREVTTTKITAYVLARKEEGLANATVNRETELLLRAFRLAAAASPAKVVRVPGFPKRLPENNARQGFFEDAELDSILPLLPEVMAEMTRFAHVTGWRKGELLGLRWEWVDLRAGEIRIPDSKNGEPRALPLDGELLAIMERRWKARAFEGRSGSALSDFVFHVGGRPIPHSTFGKAWRKACVAKGLGRYVKDAKGRIGYAGKLFHDLRRTAARNLTGAGVSEQVSMKITGHKTTSMFRRYNIVTTDDVRLALRLERGSSRRPGRSNVVNLSRRK